MVPPVQKFLPHVSNVPTAEGAESFVLDQTLLLPGTGACVRELENCGSNFTLAEEEGEAKNNLLVKNYSG